MSSQWLVGPGPVMAFVVVLCLVIGYLMPRFTRPDVYFAVTVPPEFRDSADGWSILKRYRLGVVVFSVAALLVVLAGTRLREANYMAAAALGGLCLQGIGVFVAYYRARGQVMPHAVAPATVREAALVPREIQLPGGWLLQIPPFALLAGTAIWLQRHWDEIPAVFPIHWGADGRPNDWTTRSVGGVYGPLLMGVVVAALMGFLAYAVLRWSRPIRVGGTAGEGERRFRTMVASILVAIEYSVALEFMCVVLLPLAHSQSGPPGLAPMLAIALGSAVVVVVLIMRYGQGGTRLTAPPVLSITGVAPVGDRTPDKYWKLGLFYVNRADPALFVEKRFGVGYTINLGHPGVWVVAAVLVAVFVAINFLIPSHHGP